MTNCFDYGCNQSPGCPARIKPLAECHVACSPPKRTCNELGTCQGRVPACPDCTWQLAPGVIDGPHQRHSRWYTSELAAFLRRHALVGVVMAALSVSLGFLAGHFHWLR